MTTSTFYRRIFLSSLAIAAVVYAVVAFAAGIWLSNEVEGANMVHAGDTLTYVEGVRNANPCSAEMSVEFTYPDGSNETLDGLRVWGPNEEQTYRRAYRVTGSEPAVGTTPEGTLIRSMLMAEGFIVSDTDELEAQCDDEIGGAMGKTSVLLKPGISIATTVDFDGNGDFSESETFYAGPAIWRAVVTNDGNCPLTVSLSDSTGHDFGAPFSLAAKASKTIEFTTEVTDDYTNTVAATGVDAIGGPNGTVSDDDPATVEVIAPLFTVEKSVDFDGDGVYSTDSETGWIGQEADWRIVVTNVGKTQLRNVNITDDNGRSWTIDVLAPSASETFEYTTVVTGSLTNLATAIALDVLGNTVTVSDPAEVVGKAVNAKLSLSKLVDFDADGEYSEDTESGWIGYDAKWRLVVTNSGDSPLYGVTVTDDNGKSFGPIEVLASGESKTYDYTTTVDETFVNQALAKGTDVLGYPVEDADAATVVATPRPLPDLAITKTADEATADADELVEYTLTFQNIGNGAAVGYTIVDDFDERYMDVVDAAGGTVSDGKISWTFTDTLDAGASDSISYTVRVKPADALPLGTTDVINTVVIATPMDSNETNNRATSTVEVDNPFLPFTDDDDDPKDDGDDEPYLPFTGGEAMLLGSMAMIALTGGLGLRVRTKGDC